MLELSSSIEMSSSVRVVMSSSVQVLSEAKSHLFFSSVILICHSHLFFSFVLLICHSHLSFSVIDAEFCGKALKEQDSKFSDLMKSLYVLWFHSLEVSLMGS